jgi:hypothetical protein
MVYEILTDYFKRGSTFGSRGCASLPSLYLKVPEAGYDASSIPFPFFLLFHSPPESALQQPWRCTWILHSIFDQNVTKSRVRDQANSHRSLVQRAAVQRIRPNRRQSEMPTLRANRVGCRFPQLGFMKHKWPISAFYSSPTTRGWQNSLTTLKIQPLITVQCKAQMSYKLHRIHHKKEAFKFRTESFG